MVRGAALYFLVSSAKRPVKNCLTLMSNTPGSGWSSDFQLSLQYQAPGYFSFLRCVILIYGIAYSAKPRNHIVMAWRVMCCSTASLGFLAC